MIQDSQAFGNLTLDYTEFCAGVMWLNSRVIFALFLSSLLIFFSGLELELRENLKKHNSVLKSLFSALNEYNFALIVLNYCDDSIQPCLVENGILYIDENAPFKE